MNYLAHAYLSFSDDGLLVGNMISDFVKGKKKFDYPIHIQNGINLHRLIDDFTDHHMATKEAEKIFKPVVGRYAGAFVDAVYDHFLAIEKNQFANAKELLLFTDSTYRQLGKFQSFFPEKFQRMFPYMQTQNWLYNYQFRWGIEKSFGGVFRRANYLEPSSAPFEAFQHHYTILQECYNNFFPDVKKFTFLHIENFTSKNK